MGDKLARVKDIHRYQLLAITQCFKEGFIIMQPQILPEPQYGSDHKIKGKIKCYCQQNPDDYLCLLNPLSNDENNHPVLYFRFLMVILQTGCYGTKIRRG